MPRMSNYIHAYHVDTDPYHYGDEITTCGASKARTRWTLVRMDGSTERPVTCPKCIKAYTRVHANTDGTRAPCGVHRKAGRHTTNLRDVTCVTCLNQRRKWPHPETFHIEDFPFAAFICNFCGASTRDDHDNPFVSTTHRGGHGVVHLCTAHGSPTTGVPHPEDPVWESEE